MVEDNKQIQNPKDDDISFSTNEIDDIINSAEITEEVKNDDALDEYGVWIKIPPEDYKETEKPALNSPELASAEKINQDLTDHDLLIQLDEEEKLAWLTREPKVASTDVLLLKHGPRFLSLCRFSGI